jgi:hypothetical protein
MNDVYIYFICVNLSRHAFSFQNPSLNQPVDTADPRPDTPVSMSTGVDRVVGAYEEMMFGVENLMNTGEWPSEMPAHIATIQTAVRMRDSERSGSTGLVREIYTKKQRR